MVGVDTLHARAAWFLRQPIKHAGQLAVLVCLLAASSALAVTVFVLH